MSTCQSIESPLPEVHAQQADWMAEPSNQADRRHALQALAAPAGTSEADPVPVHEIPPLPEGLRARWEKAYGKTAPAGGKAKRRFLTQIRKWFAMEPAALAWGGGLAVVALVTMLFVRPEPAGSGLPTGPVTRGAAAVVSMSGAAAPVYLIAGGAEAEAVLSKLRAAFPARPILVVDSRARIPAGPAIVLENLPDYQNNSEAAVGAVEALD